MSFYHTAQIPSNFELFERRLKVILKFIAAYII